MRRPFLFASVVLALLICWCGGIQAADRDGDGISDEHEAILGTDPDKADTLQVVIEDGIESETTRAKSNYDGSKDVVTVEYGHIAEDRHLWRWTVAEPARLEDTVFHLYVDADVDESTGRKVSVGAPNHGTDYMVTVAGGSSRITAYDAEGNTVPGPPLTCVVDGKKVLVLADLPLARDDKGICYGLYMLCHTSSGPGDGPKMSDSSGKIAVRGMPIRSGKKILRPMDHPSNHLIDATYGTETLQRVLADKKNIVVPYNALELDGYQIDPRTVRKWPHVSVETPGAIAATVAPKGRYHVGFMMYDDRADERMVVSVDGKLRGVAVARLGTRRTWLYWLEDAIDFTGRERVELKASGNNGKHGIAYVLFLSDPPEPRELALEVKHMVAKADASGRVTLSWTTSWPCMTRLQWGESGKEPQTIEQGPPCLAHRVVLDDLMPVKHTAKAIGEGPEGETFSGEEITFTTTNSLPQIETKSGSIPLAIQNPHPFAAKAWPVTGGVPLPQGCLGNSENVRLVATDGTEVPVQIQATARWPDGSVKWLLLSFTTDVPAESEADYRLEYGKSVKRSPVNHPVAVVEGNRGVRIDTGAKQFAIDSSGNVVHSGVYQTVAEDTDGVLYRTVGAEAEITVEEDGPVRTVIKTVAPLGDKDGNCLFHIEKRIEAYRGSAFLRVHHTFVIDNPDKFTTIRRLNYQVPVGQQTDHWRVALEGGNNLHLDPGFSVRQQTDERMLLVTENSQNVEERRFVGSCIGPDGSSCAVAVRDAWQNYPKGFSFSESGLNIELCPPFEKGYYDQFPFEKEGHHRYYALLDGCYKLKQGVSKTHELLLCFESGGKREQTCRLFQEPLILNVPPKWICDSKVFYSVAPRDTEAFPLYEEAIDKNLDRYAQRREQQHDFGMLNYGDWYGERGTNWGNVEYDTQYAFFLEYIRSGDPRAFCLGCQTELHNRDNDTVHWSPDPDRIGGVYVHQMCHVGEYYDKSVPGSLGFPRGGFTVSHAWTEGHFAHYFLTGDRRSMETGRAVADYFIRKDLGRPYDFSSTRVPGWHLIMLCSAYHSTGDPYYLNAARVIIERVLEVQDKLPRPLPDHQLGDRKPYQEGGWVRAMVPGHCNCDVRHQGNAGFMIAVLLSGMKYYHDITGDEQVKQSIIRGAHYLLDETYSDDVQGFRYTSCPKHSYRAGTTPLMAEGIARAYLWTKDDRFRRVLTEALPRGAGGSSYGKGFSMYYRMAPRVLADLKAAGIELK